MTDRIGRHMLKLDRMEVTVAIFAVGVVVALVWLIVLTGHVNRVEQTRIAAAADYALCVQKIPFFRQVNLFFREQGSRVRMPVPTRAECEARRDAEL